MSNCAQCTRLLLDGDVATTHEGLPQDLAASARRAACIAFFHQLDGRRFNVLAIHCACVCDDVDTCAMVKEGLDAEPYLPTLSPTLTCCRRVFCNSNTGLNAIQFMDFASVPDIAIIALGGENSTLTEK